MKRIVSLCLTLVMVFSLPTMAFATSSLSRNINDDAVVFLDILTSFQSYDPHSMCASYKENQYVHKNKGVFVTIEKSVLMYDMELCRKQTTLAHPLAGLPIKLRCGRMARHDRKS